MDTFLIKLIGNQYKQYTVYIPEIKVLIRINIKDELENFTKHQFKLYLFQDAVTLKKLR